MAKPEWLAIGNGYDQVTLSSWNDFSDFVYHQMLNYESYIWRGQRCDNWNLESTLDRHISNSTNSTTKEWGFRTTHLDHFKYATRGRRGSNPPVIEKDNENEWWALGQHHGLATPLLDWTTSPFVAAYFAFIKHNDEQDQTLHRAIYALHKPSVETQIHTLMIEELKANKVEKDRLESEGKPIGMFDKARLDGPVKPQI